MNQIKQQGQPSRQSGSQRRPVISIIDWKVAPVSEPASLVEHEVIGEAADIRYHRMTHCDDFTPEVLATDALILWHNIPVTATGIARLQRCKAIVRNGVGFDTVDIAAAARQGIAVCNVPDYGTEEVADHAIALALALVRQLFPLDAVAKRCEWSIPDMDKLRRLSELNFAVIGLGRIGTATALRARSLGFNVIFYDPYLPNGSHKAIGVKRASTLTELLRQADVVSVHCPLNAETHHLLGRQELALLRPTAYVVNTARGAVIDKAAILEALSSGQIAGAGLDVIEHEPLRSVEEARVPNLIATCHAAFCSRESRREMRATSARIALAAVTGRPLENVVNKVEDPMTS